MPQERTYYYTTFLLSETRTAGECCLFVLLQQKHHAKIVGMYNFIVRNKFFCLFIDNISEK